MEFNKDLIKSINLFLEFWSSPHTITSLSKTAVFDNNFWALKFWNAESTYESGYIFSISWAADPSAMLTNSTPLFENPNGTTVEITIFPANWSFISNNTERTAL